MARIIRHVAAAPVKIEPSDKPIFVCACGLSKNFPLCDGSHKVARAEEAGKLYISGEDGQPKSNTADDFTGSTCA